MTATEIRPPAARERRKLVALLAITQTLGYGVLVQTFTVLLLPMSLTLGQSRTAIAGAATVSTLTGAAAAVRTVRFWLLTFAVLAQTGAVTAFLLTMVSYFRDTGFAAATAASIPPAVGALQLLSRLVPAPLAARFGTARVTAIGVARFAISTVPIALARAGAPLLATWPADWRFLVVLGTATLLAALALIPLIDRATPAGER